MDTKTAEILCKINTDFYREHAASFSATRQSAWQGWEQCLAVIKAASLLGNRGELTVFDLAAGNLRFAAFLEKALPDTAIEFYAVDNCEALYKQMPDVKYQCLDILSILLAGDHGGMKRLEELLEAPVCDLSVTFGFMHHVPGGWLREELLEVLVDRTRPGGCVIVSFWQFLNDEGLAAKARDAHAIALEELDLEGLEENDYLLGWKNLPGAYRYCHSFSDYEIDKLVRAFAGKADVVARFQADGRTGNLNTYLVFQVR